MFSLLIGKVATGLSRFKDGPWAHRKTVQGQDWGHIGNTVRVIVTVSSRTRRCKVSEGFT